MYIIIVSLFMACSDKSEDTSTNIDITCDVNGEIYAIGESYDASDGCNTCTCTADEEVGASVQCTEMECPEPEPTGCSTMSTEACEEAPTCTVIYGSSIILDTDNECYAWANEVTALGCMNADAMCTEELKHGASAEDPNDCYGFGGCMPEDWGSCGLGDYPECD